MAKAKTTKSKVVTATGVAVSREGGEERAKAIETAMIAAVEQAQRKGITDPGEVRKMMLAARDKIVEG